MSVGPHVFEKSDVRLEAVFFAIEHACLVPSLEA